MVHQTPKLIGRFLMGDMVGNGSFGKVKEGLDMSNARWVRAAVAHCFISASVCVISASVCAHLRSFFRPFVLSVQPCLCECVCDINLCVIVMYAYSHNYMVLV